MGQSQYQAGYRQGYADESRGRPWMPGSPPGSRYSQGYRQGRRDAARDVRELEALPA